jgi:hypothetical protein
LRKKQKGGRAVEPLEVPSGDEEEMEDKEEKEEEGEEGGRGDGEESN